MKKTLFYFIIILFPFAYAYPDNKQDRLQQTDSGYELWLNYKPITDLSIKNVYLKYCTKISLAGSHFDDVIVSEINRSFGALLSVKSQFVKSKKSGIQMILVDNPELGDEGYSINSDKKKIIIRANKDAGLLYATFHLIRLLQCETPLSDLSIKEIPALDLRQINHWDDLNGQIERGYAGKSLWKWSELPAKIDPRYEDYARANASIGINGIVINNVNADPRLLRNDYLEKLASLANIFRKYNIRVYLAANFAAPLKPSSTPDIMKQWGGVGNLDTANPLNLDVQNWWKKKVVEIYEFIPDFGGFLVKANSEGMPGPQDYGCSHAEGANLLARALKPYGGIVMWRTFVYNAKIDKDRIKRSYKEFLPLDGQFDDNVILQTKTGPLDFQPSEPVQPLFGAIRKTPLMAELQITQEYIGQSTYLVYLEPMWREFFDFDTYCNGKGSTVSKIVKGEVYPQKIKAIAGVANTGDTPNWTGHHFAQANWYVFGRLAWDSDQTTKEITESWIKSTWNCDDDAVAVINEMMMPTWKNFVASNSPYGLGLTTKVEDHFRAGFHFRLNKEWKADKIGIGTDRTTSGSDYVSQYFEPNRSVFNDINKCPEHLLLCFHYADWNHKMKSGKTLREDFFEGLKQGVKQVDKNIILWESLKSKIDTQRYQDVMNSLRKEKNDAKIFYTEAYSFFSNTTGY